MTDRRDGAVAAIGRIDMVPLILDIVCRTTGMGFAAVARVTEDRWLACCVLDRIAFGLEAGGELPVATTLCSEVRDGGTAVAIDDADIDPVYCGHPTPKLYNFRSYVSVPIERSDGSLFGTLCAIDPQARPVNTPAMLGMFTAFATLIARALDQMEDADSDRLALDQARSEAQLREEFIAVLGHDLRNPLAAVSGGVRLLRRHVQDEAGLSLLQLMDSSVRRMAGLIDNVMDFARGRLGGGIGLAKLCEEDLEPILSLVAEELRTAQPDRRIALHFDLARRVVCDRLRIGQLFSNLLANALTHGAADGLIEVWASTADGGLAIEVANEGTPIPQAAMAQLFQPFYRSVVRPSQQGLGLGLYIASMIAKAHGGTVSAQSSGQETRFTFRIPAGAVKPDPL